MKCDQVYVLTTFIVASFSFKLGVSISCYQCNSAYDPRCGDPFDPYTLGVVNCSLLPVPEHLIHNDYEVPVICRKIIQKIYSKRRVIRGCGYITEDRTECYRRSGTFDVDSTFCACKDDICNGSHSLGPSRWFLVTSVIAALIILVTWNGQLL
uniref:Protein sleepless n=1 Tax=Cacopsylla melanoneura TaxID=428564 RepID=A0A8D9EIF0_9HEMI